jgi:hypothetical protein
MNGARQAPDIPFFFVGLLGNMRPDDGEWPKFKAKNIQD